jgi:hypothetical protein
VPNDVVLDLDGTTLDAILDLHVSTFQ